MRGWALLLIVLTAAIVGGVFAIMPSLDLAITSWFFHEAQKKFLLALNPVAGFLRDASMWAVFLLAAALCIALAVRAWLMPLARTASIRMMLFLLLTLAIGPGILVNSVLKDVWSRPRPIEVTEFGGPKPFSPWWQPHAGCEGNCSFPSGESSTAAWMIAPALLLPAPWTVAGVTAAVVFSVAVGALRILFGGHFTTDVVFGILITSLTIWIMQGLMFRWMRVEACDNAVDRAIARAFGAVRRRIAGGSYSPA